ncbi:MAG: EF-P beta-lysylation protein EpmB [Porticoccaceae bacterium]|nr:EF-P beta-lysylation protein EpmB [Porticoccaceae bacterium]
MITQTTPNTIMTSNTPATTASAAAATAQGLVIASSKGQSPQWKMELRNAVTSSGELLKLLDLDTSPLADAVTAKSPFPLRAPLSFVARMEKGNPDDPLLKQVLPLISEEVPVPGFSADPLMENAYNPTPGIIHKYQGRVLLISTPVCAINCRYCFRRHFPYGDNNPGKRQWLESLDYIRGDTSIREVILSGGDPLATDDEHLSWLVGQLDAIPQLKRLRIHSRLPVVIPSRINDDCLAWMLKSRLKLSMVVHINHGNEINHEVSAAIARLRTQGIMVFNQSVLLKGINDNTETLIELSEKLFDAGIVPYYLHTLDPVAGAGHFHCDTPAALTLYRELQRQLPGYLLPKLVRDVPGTSSKLIIVPQNP